MLALAHGGRENLVTIIAFYSEKNYMKAVFTNLVDRVMSYLSIFLHSFIIPQDHKSFFKLAKNTPIFLYL